MEEIRLGIIGFGAQGQTYAEHIARKKVKNVELGAICDIDRDKELSSRTKYPDISFYKDYIDLLNSGDVDAIITCTPHYLHPVMGIEAMKRDIHVLLEKPAGVYTKQVQELNNFYDNKSHLTFAIMFNQRTNKLFKDIYQIIHSEELGEIRYINWIITDWWRPQAYYDQSDWRATWSKEGGGVLVNQAPHQLDLLQWIFGMPRRVFSNVKYGFQRNISVEDDVSAIFDYENGATGFLKTCTHDIVGTNRLEVLGDKGKIIVENGSKLKKILLDKTENEFNQTMSADQASVIFKGVENKSLYYEEVYKYNSKWGEEHIKVIENFAHNILFNSPLIANAKEGIKGVELANSILLSSWLNREVVLPIDKELYLNELNKKIEQEKANDIQI